MQKECHIVYNEFNLSEEDYTQIYLNSVEASFADQETKEWCLSRLEREIETKGNDKGTDTLTFQTQDHSPCIFLHF